MTGKEVAAVIKKNEKPCEDAKQKLIKNCQPPTDDWEQYADKLHDIAYKNGYEQAEKDLACTDAVSRQAAIDVLSKWLHDVFGIKESDGTTTVFKRLRKLPSVSPAGSKDINVTTKDKNVTTTDCVSRQAVEKITWEEPSYSDPLNVLTEVRDKIRALPSVSPARLKGKWIWDDEGYHCSECWHHAYGNTAECLDGTYRYCPNCGAQMEESQNIEYADNDTAYGGLQSAT